MLPCAQTLRGSCKLPDVRTGFVAIAGVGVGPEDGRSILFGSGIDPWLGKFGVLLYNARYV